MGDITNITCWPFNELSVRTHAIIYSQMSVRSFASQSTSGTALWALWTRTHFSGGLKHIMGADTGLIMWPILIGVNEVLELKVHSLDRANGWVELAICFQVTENCIVVFVLPTFRWLKLGFNSSNDVRWLNLFKLYGLLFYLWKSKN